jgi:hypothetical protein
METKILTEQPFTRDEYYKQYYQDNKEKMKQIREKDSYKEAIKRFYEKNPNYWDNYYSVNKDIINKRKREDKIKCEICNIEITKAHKSDHSRSKRHISNAEKQGC